MASPRLTWDSPFSIIEPRVPEASVTSKSFQSHWFYNAILIEASSRLLRGLLEALENYCVPYAKRIEASSRLARGFQKLLFLCTELIEARSRLWKTIVFLMQNASRLHRGLLEALKNHWLLYSRPHRGSLEALENYCFPCGKRMGAASRLAQGSREPLVFL